MKFNDKLGKLFHAETQRLKSIYKLVRHSDFRLLYGGITMLNNHMEPKELNYEILCSTWLDHTTDRGPYPVPHSIQYYDAIWNTCVYQTLQILC